jgi:trigger factor
MEQGAEAQRNVLQVLLDSVEIPMPENVIAAEVEAHFEDGHEGDDDHRAEVETQARESLKSQFVLDKIAEKEEVSVGETELSAWLVQQAPRYGMSPDAFAQALVEAGQVPMAIQDIRRAKALAVVLESATVVDEDGNTVDLKALDEEMRRAAGLAGMGEVFEQFTEEVVYDEDGNVVEVIDELEVVEVEEA